MSEYTPTTEQVRNFWASDGVIQPAAKSYMFVEGAAEFDRWLVATLAAHDAEVRVQALGVTDEMVQAAIKAYKAPRLHVNDTRNDMEIDMRAALEAAFRENGSSDS